MSPMRAAATSAIQPGPWKCKNNGTLPDARTPSGTNSVPSDSFSRTPAGFSSVSRGRFVWASRPGVTRATIASDRIRDSGMAHPLAGSPGKLSPSRASVQHAPRAVHRFLKEDAMPRILLEVVLEDAAVRRLAALPGVEVETIPHHDTWWTFPPDRLPGPDVLLCRRPPRDLDSLPHLKLVQLSSVGYEHLRDFGFADRPVRVCNARGIFATAIAEWNVAMMVNLARDLRGMIRHQEHAVWDRAERFHQEIRGSVVGLWGYGGIGRETARLAKALGTTVWVMTRSGIRPRQETYAEPGSGDPESKLPDRIFTRGQKREFLAGLDYLILALPHTKESDGLIGTEE